jgi:hypothetical protein
VLVALAFYAFVVAVDMFFIDGMRQALDQLEGERERYAPGRQPRPALSRTASPGEQQPAGRRRAAAPAGAGVADGDARHALAEAGGRIEVIAKIQRELHNRMATRCRSASSPRPSCQARPRPPARGCALVLEGGEQPLHADQATPVTLVHAGELQQRPGARLRRGRFGQVLVRLDQSGPPTS